MTHEAAPEAVAASIRTALADIERRHDIDAATIDVCFRRLIGFRA